MKSPEDAPHNLIHSPDSSEVNSLHRLTCGCWLLIWLCFPLSSFSVSHQPCVYLLLFISFHPSIWFLKIRLKFSKSKQINKQNRTERALEEWSSTSHCSRAELCTSRNKVQWKEQVSKTRTGETLEMRVYELLEGRALSQAEWKRDEFRAAGLAGNPPIFRLSANF